MNHLSFPDSTVAKMKKLMITDADIRDVYSTGNHIKRAGSIDMMVKRYPHMHKEIGFLYKQDPNSNRIIIMGPWKKDI